MSRVALLYYASTRGALIVLEFNKYTDVGICLVAIFFSRCILPLLVGVG